MTEIIFIVDGFDNTGEFQTVEDKYRSICGNWINKIYNENKQIWMNTVGKRIKFQAYSTITSFDPNKRYFYFCVIRNNENDVQKYFTILDRDMQKRFSENNVGIIFAEDLESVPMFNWDFFIKQLEWIYTVRDYSGFKNIKIYFTNNTKFVPEQENFIKFYFNNSIKFLFSPMFIEILRGTRLKQLPDFETVFDGYLKTEKRKQFLCLNLEPRFSRITMLHGLRAMNLLDQGYVSNLKPLHYAPNLIQNNSNYANVLKADMNTMFPEVKADEVTYNGSNNVNISFTMPTDLMNQSCYELLNETTSRYELGNVVDTANISEKTIKNLYYGRPFLMNSGPFSLKLLEDMGFKTFDWLFDQSYNNMLDNIDRQENIIKNIIR